MTFRFNSLISRIGRKLLQPSSVILKSKSKPLKVELKFSKEIVRETYDFFSLKRCDRQGLNYHSRCIASHLRFPNKG